MAPVWRREEFLDMARGPAGDFDAGLAIDWLLSEQGLRTWDSLRDNLMRLCNERGADSHVCRDFFDSLLKLRDSRDKRAPQSGASVRDELVLEAPASLPHSGLNSLPAPFLPHCGKDEIASPAVCATPDDTTKAAKVAPPYLLGVEPLPTDTIFNINAWMGPMPAFGGSCLIVLEPQKPAPPTPPSSAVQHDNAAQPQMNSSADSAETPRPAAAKQVEQAAAKASKAQRQRSNECCVTAGGPWVPQHYLRELFMREGVSIARLFAPQQTKDGNSVFWQKIHLHMPEDVDRLMAGQKRRKLWLPQGGFIQVERYEGSRGRRRKKSARARTPRAQWRR